MKAAITGAQVVSQSCFFRPIGSAHCLQDSFRSIYPGNDTGTLSFGLEAGRSADGFGLMVQRRSCRRPAAAQCAPLNAFFICRASGGGFVADILIATPGAQSPAVRLVRWYRRHFTRG